MQALRQAKGVVGDWYFCRGLFSQELNSFVLYGECAGHVLVGQGGPTGIVICRQSSAASAHDKQGDRGRPPSRFGG